MLSHSVMSDSVCDTMNCNLLGPPGSSVHGILQARILEWVAVSSSRGSSWHRDQTCISYVSCTGRQGLYQAPALGSVQFSCSVMSNSLGPHEWKHARLPCPSPTPEICLKSCPSSRWCHQTISSSVVPFSSCLQSFPASGSFPMGQFLTWGGQSTGASASASVFPISIQDWFPLGWSSLVAHL